MNKIYSKEEIIKQLQSFEKKYNTTSIRIYKELNIKPSWSTITRRFGSWNNALKEANIYKEKPNYTKNEIINTLNKVAKENNGKITLKYYNDKKIKPSLKVIKKVFGSWENALKSSNLEYHCTNKKIYSEEEILNTLKKCYKENGNYISANLYKEKGYKPSTHTISKKFGSWNIALEQAGLKINQKNEKKFTKNQIKEILKKLANKDDFLSVETYKEKCSTPSFGTVVSMFGSWNNAIKESGLKEKITYYSDEEMLKSIRDFVKKEKTTSSLVYMNKKYKPSYHSILERYKTWDNAIKMSKIKD